MKNKIIYTILFLVTILLCKAQTVSDYIAFYNGVVPKLNNVAIYKTQFYGQNFSNFYTELQSKNINITMLFCDYKTDPGSKYYILKLFFCDGNMLRVASQNSFIYPRVIITFENEIPKQVDDMIQQNHAQWSPTFAQFFANMKIEKIDFIGVKGYNVDDFSE